MADFSFLSQLPKELRKALQDEAAVADPVAPSGGVTKIIAGVNVAVTPISGLGDVTINASGGGGGGAVDAVDAPITGDGSIGDPLAIPAATDIADGYLSAADHTTFAAKVAPTRALNTTAPLTGGGDLSADRTLDISQVSNATKGVVPPLAGQSGAVPVDDGVGGVSFRKLSTDDLAPPFTINSFARAGTFPNPLEIGDSLVDPRFTATYSDTLQNPLNLINDQGPNTDPITLAALNSFGYNDFNTSGLPARTFTRSTVNGSVTWTLSAKSTGGITKTANITNSWQPRVYRGIVVPGANTEAFIEALPSFALQGSRNGTFVFAAGTGVEKIHFAWPSTYTGTPTFKDQNGFVFPMTNIATVSVTNGFGVTINYDIWRSDNFLSSAFTITVT